MNRERISGFGLRVAQAGAALMMLGGVADLAVRTLLPNHRALLGEAATPAAEALVLGLLHALGAALIAAGAGAWVILHLAHREGRPRLALVAAGIVIVAEGMNTVGMYGTGSPLFLAPLTFMILVAGGVALHLWFRSGTGPAIPASPPG